MDPFSGLLPAKKPIFVCMSVIGGLGATEVVLGIVGMCLEITGISFRYNLGQSFKLEIAGICVGLNTIMTGIWGFCTRLKLIQPHIRHFMILMGIVLCLISGAETTTMLMLSIRVARNLTRRADVLYGNATITNASTAEPDGMYIRAYIRFADALLYAFLGLLFLASFLLNCKNIRRLMKTGRGFLPKLGRDRLENGWSKNDAANPQAEKLVEEEVVIDKHGSLWILPPKERR